jgi:hypothetical protein
MSTNSITRLGTEHSFDDQLFLSASAQTNNCPSINIEYSGSFPLNQEEVEVCAVCLETPSRSYQICANKHSLCGPCLTELFKSVVEGFKFVNPSSTAFWKVYAEHEELSKCPLGRCILPLQVDIEVQDGKQGSINWLDYTPGKEINAVAYYFDKAIKTLYGLLEDGSIAYFPQVSSKVARISFQLGQQINGQISAKKVVQEESGRQIYLECSFVKLKSVFKEASRSYLGQYIEAEVEKLDEETGAPRACLPNQIPVLFYGIKASIGDIVSGYVCNEETHNFCPVLVHCTPYQVGQEIEFTIEAINPSRPSWRVWDDFICGWLNAGVRVEFIPNPNQGGSSSYQVGETISGCIRKIHAPIIEGEEGSHLVVLDCSSEDYFLEDSLSFSEESSSSTSSE